MALAETSLDIVLIIVCIIVLSSFVLCCAVLIILWRGRKSSRFQVFFYRSWWTEGFINLFILIFFSATMYTRCFTSMVSTFIYLNRFPWWTKFAQITQEHLMYIQCMNVFLTVAGRFCTICLPRSRLTATTERMKSWIIFLLQIFLPTIVVVPLYFLYEFQYGLKGITNPLLLSTIDASYDQVIFILGLTYRATALLLCFFGYVSLFWTVRTKANRNEVNILIHGGSLLLALGAVVCSSIFRRFRIGETYALMRLFYFTTMLWIPCTNIIMTICVIGSLRKRILNPFKEDPSKTSALFNKTNKRRSTAVSVS